MYQLSVLSEAALKQRAMLVRNSVLQKLTGARVQVPIPFPLLLGMCLSVVLECSRPSGGKVIIRSNLPSIAGGHVIVRGGGGRVIGRYELDEKQCLCDWTKLDWSSICSFAEATIATPQGEFELRFYGRDGAERCSTRFINLGLPSQSPFIADCEPNPARAVKRALLCAYLDGSAKARAFTRRVAAENSGALDYYLRKMARLFDATWDSPEDLAHPRFLDEPEDVGIGTCGPEKRPVNSGIELRIVLDPEGNPNAVGLVRGSGMAVLDEAALNQARQYFFVPGLDPGGPSKTRGSRGTWAGGQLFLKVPVYWQKVCPQWVLDPGYSCEK